MMPRRAAFAAAMFVISSIAFLASPAGAEDTGAVLAQPLAKADCYGCHTAAGMAAKKPAVEGAEKLAALRIDPQVFGQSVHTDLDCEDCHGKGVAQFPHQGNLPAEVKVCPQCHRRFNTTIVPEFARSVHAKLGPPAFTCYACHDPHNVRKAPSLGTERALAHRDNGMCLGCHGDDAQYAKWSSGRRPDLDKVHSWQPNPQVHWTAVRCIDCHTPEKPNGAIAHDILPKAQAERHCVDCHSTNSSLLTRLYRHEVEAERTNGAGFINAYVLTQAYVLGVTRNVYLDWASLALFLAVLAGLCGHGLLRYVGRRLREGRK